MKILIFKTACFSTGNVVDLYNQRGRHMRFPSPRTTAILAADLLLLLFSLCNRGPVLERAQIPFQAREEHGTVIVHQIVDPSGANDLQVGDELMK